ncbi:MAG: hypothetical protein HXY50_13640 [Ignavibacteriaceae bacterium]|nr:hypothetical protein [Ignavibacteriaceae bacterium]
MYKLRKYSNWVIIIGLLLLWTILFELILPVNSVFPKPSIVMQSFNDLLNKYFLIWNFLSTVSAIYTSMFISVVFIWILFPHITGTNFLTDIVMSLEWSSRYIPGIFLSMLFIYWFPKSEVTKFIFATLISFTSFSYRAKYLAENVPKELTSWLPSFEISSNQIKRNVVWKMIQPKLFDYLIKQNLYLWASVVIFEYMNLGLGVGTILRNILLYNDLSALVMMLILITIFIYSFSQLIKFIKNKYYFW